MILNSPMPLRVAMVASSLRLAGAEKQTCYMTRALLEAGTDVRFFHLGNGGHYEASVREIGVPFMRIYKPNRPLVMLTWLAKAFWEFRPQVMFAPQFGDLLQGGLAARLCRALTLGGVRSDGFYELNSNGRRSSWMLRLAHGLIANSYCATYNLTSHGVKPSKIKVLPNVLDLREFDARSQQPPPVGIPSNRLMAVAVGSLHPGKRFDRFLKALALARQRAPALMGVIAGADCGSGQALAQEADQLGLVPNHIVFLGECHDVPALLTQAAFLVLPSQYEGFPNVILEGMAARLPVLTTPAGDAESIVLEDQTGYVVKGCDLEGMAERMASLALSPGTRLRLGTAGRRRVAAEYAFASLPQRLLSVFRDFAREHHRPALVQEAYYARAVPDLAETHALAQHVGH